MVLGFRVQGSGLVSFSFCDTSECSDCIGNRAFENFRLGTSVLVYPGLIFILLQHTLLRMLGLLLGQGA